MKVICHMTISIDGKTSGDFLSSEQGINASNLYYKIHRELKDNNFACGKITMNDSFVFDHYEDIIKYDPIVDRDDYIIHQDKANYAISFDRKGSLLYQDSMLHDEDVGYDKSYLIQVLTKQVDDHYLGYLKAKKINYLFGGDDDLDLNLVLNKLEQYFHIDTLLLEGGSIINGAFLKANLIDELSIVIANCVANHNDNCLFDQSVLQFFKLKTCEVIDGVVWLRYEKV